MAAKRTHRGTALLILGCCFLQLCGAAEVNCTVTRDADLFTYSVPEVKASGCEFSWAKHDQVLRNQEIKDHLGNISFFTSSECFPRIDYQRSCTSESMDFTASCHTNCSKTCYCTVTLGADRTTYSVPEVKASGCEFSWANASDAHHHVLGNQEKEDRLVNIASFTSLNCVPRVDYKRKCASEPFKYTASCLTDCSGMEVTAGSHSWIAAVIIPVILVLLLVGFLGYKYRIKVLEWIGAYTPVEKVDQEAPDEAEKTTGL